MEHREFENRILDVISFMEKAGYDPLVQFTGYLQTGNDTFITRTGDARSIVRSLDKEQIAACVETHYNYFKGGVL